MGNDSQADQQGIWKPTTRFWWSEWMCWIHV